MESHSVSTSINCLPDELLFTILRRSFKPLATCESYISSLWTSSRRFLPLDEPRDEADLLLIKTPVSAPSSLGDAAHKLCIASVCSRWRHLVKLHVTTLFVKGDNPVSREDLSAAVACFANLTHLHVSDNSAESLNDAFLAHLALSCPKLTALHVGTSVARRLRIDRDGLVKYHLKKKHRMTTEVLDLFFQALPELELVTLFCQKAELPNSFFQLRRLHTFFLTDASAMQKPGFTNLTGLTTLHITFLMNHRHLSNLLHLPRLTRLFTSALHLSHQPAGAESVTLPSCLKSLSFFSSCSGFTTIFPSAWLFTALEELLISNCSELETLPDDIGDVLPCLRKLIIRQCKTSVHLPESFTLLSHLETLVISSVVTLALPSNFGHMPALKLLVLEKLHFTELPPSFCHLTSLETLFLVDCFNLQQLPAGFCSLTALKALCFSKTYRLALPEDVGALASLKALKLHACQEHPLPASFTQLSALTSLELNACRLGFPVPLPEALGELSRLQELKIIELSVATLPSSLIQLTRLQTLEVRGCRLLEEVPTRLDMLLGLKRLEMTACPRLTVPPAGLPPSLETLCLGPFWGASSHVVDISQLSHLRVLKLNRVGVTCGPAVASRLSCLEQLEQLEMRLGGDSCELPVPVTLISLCHLRSLLIDVPGLCSLPETMAAALPELRQLELRSWMPEELPGGILELRSLTSLSINAPRLTVVPQGMSRLIRLRILELIRCNALQHLPEFLTQLHRLILRDTPISSLPANRMPAD